MIEMTVAMVVMAGLFVLFGMLGIADRSPGGSGCAGGECSVGGGCSAASGCSVAGGCGTTHDSGHRAPDGAPQGGGRP